MTTFNDHELQTLRRWAYKVDDRSVLSRLLQPIWNALVELLPRHAHPNLISLSGFLCVLYLFVLSQRHAPSLLLCCAVAALSTVYTFLDALDGKQARRIHSSSVVGELFDHALDNLSMVLLLLAYLTLSGVSVLSPHCENNNTHTESDITLQGMPQEEREREEHFLILCAIFSLSVAFLSFHLDAYLSRAHVLVFGVFSGQNEAMLLYALLVLYAGLRERVFSWLSLWDAAAAAAWGEIERGVAHYAPYLLAYCAALYLCVKVVMAVKLWRHTLSHSALSHKSWLSSFSEAKELQSVVSVVLVYALRLVGALGSLSLSAAPWSATLAAPFSHATDAAVQAAVRHVSGGRHIVSATTLSYLCEGFVLSMPTTEIILCKMSDKPFSPLIVTLTLASLIDDRLALLGVAYYYLSLFYTLTAKLSIPFLRPKRRLYCCGVFDMCHKGHMLLFQRCASLADEVVVGVHNDEDVASYKRTPNVSHSDRCETVSLCKCVHEVIPNAPLYLDREFLTKHHIDVVVCSDEYDSPDDKYYAVAREMGILHVLTRTEGVSSSGLMKNIMSRKSD